MSIYTNCELLPANTLFPDIDEAGYWAIPFGALCKASVSESTPPLQKDLAALLPYAQAVIGHFWSGHGNYRTNAVSYAAVTGFTKQSDGSSLAEIGNVITLPSERGLGHATSAVGKVIELASTKEATAEHGHAGFFAAGSAQNIGFFVAKFGFEVVETESGLNKAQSHIAVKLFDTSK